MEMTTKNVSLSQDLKDFATRDIAARSFSSFSAYVSDLIRQRREAVIAEDLAVLERNIPPADEAEPGPEYWSEFYKEVRQKRKGGK